MKPMNRMEAFLMGDKTLEPETRQEAVAQYVGQKLSGGGVVLKTKYNVEDGYITELMLDGENVPCEYNAMGYGIGEAAYNKIANAIKENNLEFIQEGDNGNVCYSNMFVINDYSVSCFLPHLGDSSFSSVSFIPN